MSKKRPKSRWPGSPQTRQPSRETSVARTPVEDDTIGIDDGEQLPPPGVLYPQILRTPDRNRLRAIGGIVIGVALFILVTNLISQIVVLISWRIAGDGAGYPAYYSAASRFEKPSGMLAANLGIAALIPISMGLVGFAHRVRPRWLASVRPGLRWRYLVIVLVTALVALGGVQALSMVFGPAVQFRPQPGFWAFLVVIVLTSPLQAAGEEYFFRGYLMQSLGSMVASPVFSIVVSSLIFAFAHFSLNPALFADRLAFGLAAALLVRYTGGLEAGIAAHVVNNLLAFILAGLTSTIATVRGLTSVGWATAGVDVGGFVLFALLAGLVARALKLQTRVAEWA